MPQICGMFIFRTFLLASLLLQAVFGFSQIPKAGSWLFTMTRQGGLPVYTIAELHEYNGQWELVFINDTERLNVQTVQLSRDSLIFSMPVFETQFRLALQGDEHLVGSMTKSISTGQQVWQVEATYGAERRIPAAKGGTTVNLSGRWAMEFQRADGSWRPAVGELTQVGSKLTGTIINPSGDYRFLEGEVWDNHLYLTAFDGAHIYAFRAEVKNDSIIDHGLFFSGNLPGEHFKARRNPQAKLPELAPVAEMKKGMNQLSFRFPDLDSNMVSINDARFKNKVVIVQLMGSWCPNCMDETRFLSEFYNNQRTKDVEIVSLAYELSTDFHRSASSLRKFQQRFGVQYPMLITGARSADADKGAKTLPQLTDVKYFPTTIFIDKLGRVRKVHNGFYGPGAPDYYEAYRKEFFKTIEMLKAE